MTADWQQILAEYCDIKVKLHGAWLGERVIGTTCIVADWLLRFGAKVEVHRERNCKKERDRNTDRKGQTY